MQKSIPRLVAIAAATLITSLSSFADSYTYNSGSTTSTRAVKTITVKSGDTELGTITGMTYPSSSSSRRNIYQDMTDTHIKVEPGQKINIYTNGSDNTYSCTYIYIDYDLNGSFDVDPNGKGLNSETHTLYEPGELVTYNAYGSSGSALYTSIGGTSKAGSEVRLSGPDPSLPQFTLPNDLTIGKEYRCRYVQRWNSIDPTGNQTDPDGNTMSTNGGEIVDFIFEVVAPASTTPTLSFAQPTGGTLEVKNAEGTALENGAELEDGTVLTIVATPDDDHLSGTVTANGTALTANEDGTYTYTTSGSTTIAATFTEKYAHYTGVITRKDGSTNQNFYLGTITLSDASNNNSLGSITGMSTTYGRTVYQNMTGQSVTVYPNQNIKITTTGGEGWAMHMYAYIDYNNDGVFNTDLNDDGTPTTNSDVVAYSLYNGKDSKGNSASGSSTYNSTLPTFTIPANLAEGTYRMRYKVDWDNIDPAGSSSIGTNAGEIVDFYINVVKTEHTVTIEQADGGSISVTKDGENVNSNDVVNSGEKLKIAVSPKDDYLIKTVTVNGDAISADADGYYYYTVDGVDFTIAAEFVLKSEYKLTVNFDQPSEGGKIVVKANGAEIESGAEIAYETPITIEATPNTFAWQVGSITLNGSALDADNGAYSFSLTQNATIAATFETKYTHNDGTIKMESAQNTNRSVFGITLTNEKNVERGKVSLTEISEGDTRALWQDMTAQSIKVCPGDELTISVKGMGCDLGEYLFIDWNNNGKFEYDAKANTKVETVDGEINELVSYNMDRIDGAFYNSKGETVNRTNNTEGLIDGPYFYLPSFTVPDVEPGKYYARFKIDWASNDPDKAGTGCAGEIIDFVIEVCNEVKVSVPANSNTTNTTSYGSVKIQETDETSALSNDVVTVEAVPNEKLDKIEFMCWTDKDGNILSKEKVYKYNVTENTELVAHFGFPVYGKVKGNASASFSYTKNSDFTDISGNKQSAPSLRDADESSAGNIENTTVEFTSGGTTGVLKAGQTAYLNTSADSNSTIRRVYIYNQYTGTTETYALSDDTDVTDATLAVDVTAPIDVLVEYYAINTGVEDIAVDAEAEAEYYNLNGVRVSGDLVPGVYIRRAAGKTEKVVVK